MKGTKPHLVVDNSAMKSAPLPPSWMSKDAKTEWKRVTPILIERRILTDADLGSLENYCICIGRIRETEVFMQTANDHDTRIKLFRVQDKAMASARLLAAELGLTPVSRSRPTIREDDDADTLLDI